MNDPQSPAVSLWSLHSKREKLACITDFARWKLGLLNKYLSVDYSRVDRVIFVCKGNICRSAYAEARFNLLERGPVRAISAGTEAKESRVANISAIRVAAQRGVDLQAHRTQNIRSLSLEAGDLLVCMERAHADIVGSLSSTEGAQILLLGGLIGAPRMSDPYGRDDAYFIKIFARLEASVEVLSHLLNKA